MEAIEHAQRWASQDDLRDDIEALGRPTVELPLLTGHMDVGCLFELAAPARAAPAHRGRRVSAAPAERPARASRPAPPVPTAPAMDLQALIEDPATRILVCCGAGGVGKTTTSAALALAAAEAGRTVVVLTIDPARRLAQSLGLEELDNEPRRVDVPGAPGELHAMMLDMKRTFDDVVVAHSTPERAQQILDNPFYQSLSSSFSGTQEYMAMEKLGQLRASDQWDLIIVDTPPSRSALDFLDAPNKMGRFLDGTMIRLLAGSGRAGLKFASAGFMFFSRIISKILRDQGRKERARRLPSADPVVEGQPPAFGFTDGRALAADAAGLGRGQRRGAGPRIRARCSLCTAPRSGCGRARTAWSGATARPVRWFSSGTISSAP